MANKSVTYALSHAFADYLKAEVDGLVAVYDDFPSASQQLKYPCASLFMRSPTLQNAMPYVVARGEPNASTHKALVRRCVGRWEVKFQLDVWCANKFERHAFQEKLFLALKQGVTLTLADYFNELASYTMLGLTFPDRMEESQRDEWRIKIDLVADVRATTESLDYLMETIENNFDVKLEIPTPPSDEQEAEPIL